MAAFFTLFGGIAFFLFGMRMLSTKLEAASGERIQRVFASLGTHKAWAFFVGAVTTAVVQSSSATTVMVVGLVNAGLLSLRASIPIIMGANLGTTATAWLIGLSETPLTGILAFFKPSFLYPILAVGGAVLVLFFHTEGKRHLGELLMGIALLFLGMKMMSDASQVFSSYPAFQNAFLLFENPLLGVLLGTVLTGIIQSSSASVGILQALSVGTYVSFRAAIPIIMGQNIGTCVTTLIAGIGGGKNARRAAFVHLYFNVAGTVFLLPVYTILDALLTLPFSNLAVTPLWIACLHTLFQIVTTLTLLPLQELLYKVSVRSVPEKAKA